MSEDIIEVKPGLGWFKLNVNALVRKWGGKSTSASSSTEIVARRFVQIFEVHGVTVPQIPRFLSDVTLASLQSTEKLLAVLTPSLLEETAKLFGIQRVWLEGASDRIYDTHTCYKQSERLFEQLRRLPFQRGEYQLRVLTSVRELDFQSSLHQPLALVLVEKLREVDDREALWPIERYHIYGDSWDWSHPPARIQLKAMARILDQLERQPIPMYQISHRELMNVLDGKCVPRAFVDRCLTTSPSLEDYGNSAAEHGPAKETEEMPVVLDYIERHDLVRRWRDLSRTAATQPG
ncbi:MAG: hypothetical protein JWM32_3113 [Verrucomicrobia bacterium]|nr:hypothetical protein [Verrucomicrobiota bacterium]